MSFSSATMTADRKISYKVPPTTITDKLISQEARRGKALEEQKRRRAQRVDSSRQLDLFADLNLGPSDDEDAQSPKEASGVSLASVAPYAAMLEHDVTADSVADPIQLPQLQIRETQKDGFRKPKKKRKNRNNKTSKWADKCMYAELLEMASDDPWSTAGSNDDGLPKDLERGWVAVGPVPVGKRCLAVTHQSSGIAGVAPNTTLRSRLLGKLLIQRFPSSLPPLTILDCILDSNWRQNGILHVLDVVKWKGQDVGDCETPFRLWWRDTRLTELAQSTPVVIPPTASITTPTDGHLQYQFPYPTTFLPVPYHTDTTLSSLSEHVIPFARSSRSINIDVPILETPSPIEGSMEVDTTFRFASAPASLVSVSASVPSDGLLLYVAEASYEAGTSPLSSWIPIANYSDEHAVEKPPQVPLDNSEGPLDIFQRLVERKLSKRGPQIPKPEVTMDMDI